MSQKPLSEQSQTGATKALRQSAKPSAHDVARLAGVSQAAVSRAFTPGASISEATRSKVMQAAADIGYRPNLLARSLITGKSGIVGVVIGSPRNPFYLEALDYLSRKLAEDGRHLLVFTANAKDKVDALIDSLLRFQVDSLILMSARLSDDLAQQCRQEGVPIVFFSRRAQQLSGFPSVTASNRKGGTVIAQHLAERGYRRFAYLGGDPDSSTSQERGEGFIGETLALGLAEPIVAYGQYSREGAVTEVRAMLQADDRPDAIFCANDMMALAAIETARLEFGLDIGPELGVAGFDNIEGASWASFDLTTYGQPVEDMVDAAIAAMTQRPEYDEPLHVEVEGELIIRSSTQR